MIVRGVIKDGAVQLLSPIPAEWEGRKVRIRAVRRKPTPEEVEAWGAEMDRLSALIDPEDDREFRRIMAEEHDREKASLRREEQAMRLGQEAT